MKKSLVALAVLAASGASFAQSVTVYGLADVYLASVRTDDGKGATLTQTKLDSGAINSSRWGLKGTEDLGGGLKANFLLEQGFDISTGAGTAGQAFSRQAYVGFSGGFGEVKLGKVWTAYDDVSGASDAVFDSALSPMNHVFVSTNYQANPGNTIYYVTPTFNGFNGAFSYSLGENKTATLDASSVTAVNLAYGAGPLAVHFGYQVEKAQAAASNDVKFTRLGGTYDFGVATAKLTYGKVSNVGGVNGSDASEWQIGADVPVSSALTLSVSYAKSDDTQPAGVYQESRKGWGFAGAYTLSKRTFLYGGFTSNSTSQLNASDSKLDIFAVGVQHKF